MISMHLDGDFETSKWLKSFRIQRFRNILNEAGRMGVAALSEATPVRTGKTASSWEYAITETETGMTVTWYNTHVNSGVPIAVILQYGHGTGTGGFVEGIDYVNPTMKPIFNKIAEKIEEAARNV